ncbi:MAG: ribosome-binding factor A [bacterium]
MLGKDRSATLASVLQGELSRYLLERRDGWGVSSVVLVDQVFVSPDLHSAQVWLSFSPDVEREEQFARIERRLKELQAFVFQQLRRRKVPTLSLMMSRPEETFRIHQIFDTLRSHEQNGGSHNPGSSETSSEDFTGGPPQS